MTIASTLRLSLYGVALSAISTLGLIGCSNSSTETAATAENSTATDKPAKSIAITQIVEHPSLDDMRRGIIDELADNGYVEGQNLTVNFQSAQGNTATAGQIAKQFAGDNPDAIVAISTPSAQSVVAASTTIPIIYTAVSDPLGAKLITADGKPFQSNLTGLSSQLPLEPQLDLLQQIKPDLKTIGYVYSPGEANSVSLRENLKQALPARGLSLLDIPANRPTDIGMATRSLQGRADIIYTSFDNNVASAFEAMTQAANELKLPIIASDEFSVKRGATAALGVNDYDFGRTTGKMVYRVLNGEAVDTIKPEVMNDLTLYVSPKHAKTQGVSLPAELLKNAINVDIDAETK
ncbi:MULTISPECIES: ABC transporter substrate-binding protein [Psychrobacter]|uniref:ABC transporter substrate-binding protein n=1 Tax=Psychrobacter TaxID=497 RepID=UPI0008694EBA|nr:MULTISPECIES: ABC transporter substrate-binding protein [Psychrobacter]MBA6245428.1 ABC transporter substrate-binding protein [Psychrobacter sp. Urea-trap-18]MBA6284962.1 ABC transporter substrate-binding protein [Psychrobacter sp. Urea-trap-16]MBA6318811.1 ABC transporter substrate-binding protein [Psychrobacter sp. Urea-trap-20]MBA6333110.1 ABC transporter substrate-binding protein [Psychrobacter sp. Urea-trap-19]OEH69128.1 MAG: ABC transporter substrate-binding protein [Psychrobacter sp.|tara:strand:+ start:7902 stop:8951 length:1050 start_codon:yes stop_codon:yes gene_type:complete